MIVRVERAISDSGGWVLEHKMFSNLSICLVFEITSEKMPELGANLRATGLTLTRESDAALELLAREADGGAGADQEIFGSVQVLFIHGEPELRTEVPPIPG